MHGGATLRGGTTPRPPGTALSTPPPPTRNDLIVHAVTRPLNILAGIAALIVVAVLVSGALGFLVGVAVFAAFCARTVLDASPEPKVVSPKQKAAAKAAAPPPARAALESGALPEHLAVHIRSAHRTEAAVLSALRDTHTDATYGSLVGEITGMVDEMERTAQRAKTVDRYVRSQDPAVLQAKLNEARKAGRAQGTEELTEQLKSLYRLQRRVEDYSAQLAKLTGQLSTIATKVVELALMGDEQEGADVLLQARFLREQVDELQGLLRDTAAP